MFVNLGKCRQFIVVSVLWTRQSETSHRRREKQPVVHGCSDNVVGTHGQRPGKKGYLRSGKHIWITCLKRWEASSRDGVPVCLAKSLEHSTRVFW